MKNRFFWISWKLCWELLICFCDWLRALNAIWKVPPTIIKFWNQLGIVHKSYDVSLRSLSPEWSNMYGLFITPNILNSDHLVKIIKFFLKSIRKTKSFLPHSFRIILRIIVRFPFPSTIAFWFFFFGFFIMVSSFFPAEYRMVNWWVLHDLYFYR